MTLVEALFLCRNKCRNDTPVFTVLEPEKLSTKYMSVPYYPKITNTLSKTLKKHNIQLTTTSNIYKLRNQIKSTKKIKLPTSTNLVFTKYTVEHQDVNTSTLDNHHV
jgi:hypothetical protein